MEKDPRGGELSSYAIGQGFISSRMLSEIRKIKKDTTEECGGDNGCRDCHRKDQKKKRKAFLRKGGHVAGQNLRADPTSWRQNGTTTSRRKRRRKIEYYIDHLAALGREKNV